MREEDVIIPDEPVEVTLAMRIAELEAENAQLKADIEMCLKQPQGQIAFNAGMERAVEIAESRQWDKISAAEAIRALKENNDER